MWQRLGTSRVGQQALLGEEVRSGALQPSCLQQFFCSLARHAKLIESVCCVWDCLRAKRGNEKRGDERGHGLICWREMPVVQRLP